MHLAVALDRFHHLQTQSVDPDDGWTSGQGRLLVLPASDPLTSALATVLSADQVDAMLVLYPSRTPLRLDEVDQDEVTQLEPRGDEAVEGAIALAATLLDEQRFDEAYAAYARADRLMSEELSPRRSEALVCMAGIERSRGNLAEASVLLDRALAFFPAHRGALQARIEIAQQRGDAVTTAALLHRTVAFAETQDERVDILQRVADEALSAATDSLARALALRPGDRALLGRLRAIHEASGRFEHAVNVAVLLAESLANPVERARTLVTAADMCRLRLGNVERAVALYEAAIADDPTIAGAFEAIESVLVSDQDWAGAERAYSRQLDRLADRGLANEQKSLLRKLSRLRADQLHDTTGAILALDRLVTLDPKDLEARRQLATLLETSGKADLAMRCLEVTAKLAPSDPATFQAIHRVASRSGDTDRGYSACAVLVHLGEADLDEQMLYQQFAPESSLRPLRPFDDDAWELLYGDDHDEAVSEVLRVIEPAAVALRVEELRAAKKLAVPEPKELQNPESSTLTAVRMVQWAAHLLGLELPQILVRPDDLPGGIAVVAAERPLVVLGKSALSGRAVPELAFMVTRELAFSRAAGRLPVFFRSLGELKALILAAVELVTPDGPRSRNSASLARGLLDRLGGSDKLALADAVGSLTRDRSQIDLVRWTRSVELTACRAALLAADDITVAARMLAVDGRASAGLSASDRVRDLSGFSVSQRYMAVRRLLAASRREDALA